MNELGIISQLNGTRFRRRLPDGLSSAQFYVLNNFVRLGGVRTPAQLAAAFEVTRGAMTNTLNKLQQRGCVEVHDDPEDGRSKIVSITAAGRALRQQAIDALGADLAHMSSELDMEKLRAMLPEIQRVRAWLDHNRDGP